MAVFAGDQRIQAPAGRPAPDQPHRSSRRSPGGCRPPQSHRMTQPGSTSADGTRRSSPQRAIVNGRGRVTPATAAAVLAVSGPPGARPDAGGTRLRLRALQVMGHGSARVARAIGAREQAIQKITRGDTQTVSPQLRDAIARIYDAWWDKRAPETTRQQRAAASAARRRAIRGNWCAAAGLDDDELDVPGYKPACGWRPARGTGVAQDMPAGEEEMELGA